MTRTIFAVLSIVLVTCAMQVRAADAVDEDQLKNWWEDLTKGEPEVTDVGWALVQVTPDGDVVAPLRALHASLLDTDPTGREMRPATT